MSQNQSSIPTYGFLRLPQILAIFPISKSAWWEGCRTGRYPKPIKLAPRTTVWRAEDIAAFVNQLGSQNDQGVSHE
ncbi:MAG: AlpA family phage regulatory protein [Desulfovibrionaceae bacterium]|nr:AlpA family phage regulatory protein [Desulfovibrionaceae bacterium]